MENRKKILEFSKDDYEEFFSWLLNSENIEILTQYDMSKSLDFENPYIYYTREIHDFFETSAMKRLGKIGQIPNVLLINANCYQDRLEHCKGAYQKILDFYMFQYKNDIWKNKNSTEDSKLKILADIMDMASHDIGHNVGSHALEKFLGTKKGAHEILGDRILHEDPEVLDAFKNIHPKLLEYLDIVKSQDYNLHTLKEGNIDFDRADFLSRDSLYYGFECGYELESDEKSIYEILDSIMQGCEIVSVNKDGREIECPVYSYTVEPDIENLLKRRIENYKNLYISKYTEPNDMILEDFCKYFLNSDENVGKDLKDFLMHISNSSIEDIDLNLFLEWNDIRFFNSVFEIAEKSKDPNMRNFALLCLPSVDSMISIVQNKIFSQVEPEITDSGDKISSKIEFNSEEDRNFYLKLKNIIKSKDLRYYENRINKECFGAYFSTKEEYDNFIESLKNDYGISDNLINNLNLWQFKVKAYKKDEPIFILGQDEKIYTFDEYPERKLDLNTQSFYLIFGMTPKLLLENANPEEIDLLKNIFEKLDEKNKIDFSNNINDTRLTSELNDMKYRKIEADLR